MYNNNTCNLLIVYCSFFIVIILEIICLFIKIFKIYPSWIMITLIFWTTKYPNKINVGTGFTIGIILDFIVDTILGIHSLSFIILTYVIIKKIDYFRVLSTWIQSIIIAILSIFNQIIIFLVIFLMQNTITVFYNEIFWNIILDGSIWPILKFLMYKISISK